jgi:hypothetical protein
MSFDIRDHLDRLEPNPREHGKYFCPACGGHNLSVNLATGAYNCWADDSEEHRALIRDNLSPAKPVPVKASPGQSKWDYFTIDGSVAATVTRTDFADHRPKEVRRWQQPSLIGEILPLYWEQCVAQFDKDGGRVFVVEGERCADLMRGLGLNAITFIGGSTGYKKELYYDLLFQIRDSLVLCPDMDKPGVKFMDSISQDFPDALWCYVQGPNYFYWGAERLPEKGGYDLADAIANGADTYKIISWIHRRQSFALTGKALQVDVEVNDMLDGLQRVFIDATDLAVRELKVAQYLRQSGLRDLGWTIQRAMKHCACVQSQQGVVEVLDAHDLLSMPTKRPRWIIPGFLPAASVVLLGASGGTGKAQPLDAKVLTPNGWRMMGSLKAGDKVIAGNGKPTTVLSVFPQGVKDIYRVTFSDGSATECCDEHLWYTETYCDRSRKRQKGSIKTLKQIRETIRCGKRQNRNHYIPTPGPVEFASQPVHLDPWVLGALIGDGTLYDGTPRFTSVSTTVLLEMNNRLEGVGKLAYINGNPAKAQSFSICGVGTRSQRGRVYQDNEVLNALREYGLAGKKSSEKFVPQEYLYNTVEVRLAVLQGLMDTDGTVDRSSTSFTSVSRQLAEDVRFLVCSLGGTATIATRTTTYTHNGEKRLGQSSYRVTFKLPSQFCPFLAELNRRSKWNPPTKYPPQRVIDKVEYVGRKEAQCIYVEDSDHLYVTDDFIVTHNTTLCYNLAKHVALGEEWSELPVVRGKVLIISTDESSHDTKEKLQTIDIASVPRGGVSFIRFWRFSQIDILEEKIRQIEPSLVIIDSLTSTTAGIAADRTSSSAGDCLYELRDIAERYECSFVVLHHLNKQDEFRDSTTYVDNVSEAWKLTRDKKDGDFILDYQKSRSGFQGKLVLRRKIERYCWYIVGSLGTENSWHSQMKVARWINTNLNIAGTQHWLTNHDISDRINLPLSEINEALITLRLSGLIACDTTIVAGRTVRRFAAWNAPRFAVDPTTVTPLFPSAVDVDDSYDDLLLMVRQAYVNETKAEEMCQMLETFAWPDGGQRKFWQLLDPELKTWLKAA